MNFKLGDLQHLSVILLTFIISFLFIIPPYFAKKKSTKKVFTSLLLILLILTLLSTYIHRIVIYGFNFRYDLPLNICDMTIFLVIFTLLTKNKYSFELTYFWALGGSTQALLTPDLFSSFPELEFILFFSNHSLVIVSALFMVFIFKLRPTFKSVFRVILFTEIYLIIVAFINIILKANYCYLCSKPLNSSILDHFGPWPIYVIFMHIFGLFLMIICYLPFLIRDLFVKRKEYSHRRKK